MSNSFRSKKILITGGTGSVGREILLALLQYGPEVIRILDVDENSMFQLQQELREYDNVRYLLGDVRDKERLVRAVDDIDIIFHAAGLKHVLACEYNPFEAVKTNVLGTQNLVEAAMNEEVEKVIFTSSDKAVNPASTMGTSKLLAEKLMVSANYYRGPRKTAFTCVRFGNILGSRGSVIPLFAEHIRRGGPVTITDSEMTRFVITKSSAIDLLFKAVEMAHGGEIFVMNMPVARITDVAEVLVEELAPKYGHDPRKIEIQIIGTKPGEKLYEELMTEDEARRALEVGDLLMITPELKEHARFDTSRYPSAKPTKLKWLKSKDARLLDKAELRRLIKTENLA